MTSVRYAYPTGLNGAAEDWANGGTFRAMLLVSPFVPDPSTQIMVDDVSADEFVDASYARVALATLTRTVVMPASAEVAGFVQLDCDPFSFGALGGADIATWLMIYQFVTNDADSPLLCAFATYFQSNGAALCAYTPPSSGMVRIATLCAQDVFIGS